MAARDKAVPKIKAGQEMCYRAPQETYQDRDEYNFDFEQGDSVHRRAGSPSCTDQRSSESKVFRFETCRLLCAGGVALAKPGLPAQPLAREPCHHSKSAISAHGRFPEVPYNKQFSTGH